MKRFLVVILVLAIAGVCGCATLQKLFCSNVDTINSAIAAAQATIADIEAKFPDVIPAEYQAAIASATAVITAGTAMLESNYCPSDAEVTSLSAKSAAMNREMRAAKAKFTARH